MMLHSSKARCTDTKTLKQCHGESKKGLMADHFHQAQKKADSQQMLTKNVKS